MQLILWHPGLRRLLLDGKTAQDSLSIVPGRQAQLLSHLHPPLLCAMLHLSQGAPPEGEAMGSTGGQKTASRHSLLPAHWDSNTIGCGMFPHQFTSAVCGTRLAESLTHGAHSPCNIDASCRNRLHKGRPCSLWHMMQPAPHLFLASMHSCGRTCSRLAMQGGCTFHTRHQEGRCHLRYR